MRRLVCYRVLCCAALTFVLAAPALAQSQRHACERADLQRLQRIIGSKLIDIANAPERDDAAGGVRIQCRVLGSGWRASVTFVDLAYIRNVRKALTAEAIAERIDSQMLSLTVEQPRRADDLIRASDGARRLSFTAAFSYRVVTVALDSSEPLSDETQTQLREYAERLVLNR